MYWKGYFVTGNEYTLGLLDYKPVSVPFQVAIIPLGLAFLPASSNLPGS